MGFKATKISTQIDLLKQRGLAIDDDKKCGEHLADIGYYRLGFYWHCFQTKPDENHNLIEGITLKKLIDLYYFDVDLRHILLKYIYRIEVNFRTKLVYYVSNKYCDDPIWFTDKQCMDAEFIKDFEAIYPRLSTSNMPLAKHHRKYRNDKYAPAWKTFEFMSFGAVFKAYQKLKNVDLKKIIADQYQFRNVEVFISYMQSIVEIRNVCSHSGVLFDHRQARSIRKYPAEITDGSSLYSTIIALKFILGSISKNRVAQLDKEISELFDQYKDDEILKKIFVEKSGYHYK